MVAEDVFFRAGGLACVNAILEPSLMPHSGVMLSGWLERIEGFASQISISTKLNKKMLC